MIDVLIILMYLTLSAALLSIIWAVVRTMRLVGKTSGKTHGVPVRRIKIALSITVILLLTLSFAFASTSPLTINTTKFEDVFWLRMSNMFVFTGLVSILIATAATLFSFIRQRK